MTLRRRWTGIGTLALLLLIAFAATMVMARDGVVKTKDGRTIRGDVTETDAGVTINVHGVNVELSRDDVTSIEYPESIEKQYNDRIAKLEANDVDGRLEVARWAYEHGEYKLARDATQAALDVDPNSTEATTMMATIRSQMRLEQNRQNAADNEQPTTDDDDDAPDEGEDPAAMDEADQRAEDRAANRRVERQLLTGEDVNRIRQLELRDTDNQVRVRFENDIERRFASATNQDPGAFRNLRPVQKAVRILAEGNEDFIDDVHILSDPQAMLEYRRLVQPLVLNGCATSGCHGGATGGDLILFSPADTDALTYTNFYILQSYKQPGAATEGSVFGSGEKLMIDRSNPEQSLILNMGLPTDMAEIDHPPVRGWRPIFRNVQDQRYQQVLNWIDRSINPVQPNYGIDYTPPAAGDDAAATTEPATQAEPDQEQPQNEQSEPAPDEPADESAGESMDEQPPADE